ncbi:MAG TPA: response regulator [Thermoanaerobaculia bacterium]|nr:response regulator [Thermoanaerobaculia bacterium]
MTQILIVDDDPMIRMLLQRVAERAGFAADTAADGAEALERLQERQYRVLLLDLMMPRMSGYDVVDALAALPHRPTVVIVSAMAQHGAPQLDSNVVHSIVHKPFDVELISRLLTDMVTAIEASAPYDTNKTAALEPPFVC